eukprot:6351617-Pyramimonas_sp.AAC.1
MESQSTSTSVKFYEHIDHHLLAEAAMAHGFSWCFVRAPCAAYPESRRATAGGAISVELVARGTVATGFDCAT